MADVIALSGGKDSTAMALRLAQVEPRDYEYICNATGNELPDFREHMSKLADILGKPIKRVGYRTDLYGLIEEIGMIPNHRARFCTRMLKIEPTIEYFDTLPEGSTLYVGLRADEEIREGIFGEDMDIRFPMREWLWGEAEVWKFLAAEGISIPKRTDCAVCPYQRISQWHALWRDHPEEYARGIAIEQKHGHTFRSDGRDTWPAALIDLAKEFERGRVVRPYVKKGEACRVCSL